VCGNTHGLLPDITGEQLPRHTLRIYDKQCLTHLILRLQLCSLIVVRSNCCLGHPWRLTAISIPLCLRTRLYLLTVMSCRNV